MLHSEDLHEILSSLFDNPYLYPCKHKLPRTNYLVKSNSISNILEKPEDSSLQPVELPDKDSLRIYPLTTQHPFCDNVLSMDTMHKIVAKVVAASYKGQKIDTDIPRLSAV